MNSTGPLELAVLGAVFVVPFVFALALPHVTETASGGRGGVNVIAAVTAMELPLAALAVWAVHRQDGSLESIGITRPHPAWIVIGIVVLVVMFWLTWQRHIGAWPGAVTENGPGGGAHTTNQRLALVALGVPQIYLQELLYRGYAIAVVERITGSIAAAIAIAAVAFALAHITSLAGNLAVSLFAVFITAVLLGILYTATGDIAPVFVIHWAWVAWLAVALSDHTPTW